jgi:hypothetical protein
MFQICGGKTLCKMYVIYFMTAGTKINVVQIRVLSPSDVPEPFKAGVAFDTVSVNPTEYLPWLQSELISRGVTFERRNVRSFDELRSLVGPDGILVNASSLGKGFLSEVALVTSA